MLLSYKLKNSLKAISKKHHPKLVNHKSTDLSLTATGVSINAISVDHALNGSSTGHEMTWSNGAFARFIRPYLVTGNKFVHADPTDLT